MNNLSEINLNEIKNYLQEYDYKLVKKKIRKQLDKNKPINTQELIDEFLNYLNSINIKRRRIARELFKISGTQLVKFIRYSKIKSWHASPPWVKIMLFLIEKFMINKECVIDYLDKLESSREISINENNKKNENKMDYVYKISKIQIQSN